MGLFEELESAGLTVRGYLNWQTRGHTWFEGKPIGVMQHHTAAPVPFPVSRLIGSRLKANINTKPDGTVWVLAYRACNYSSGPGSSVVLDEVRNGTPPSRNARERGLSDNINGNPFFFNFENDHLGDGGAIPQIQHDAIVTATQVVLDHFDLSPGNVISHAEWTARKRDPYWNGSLRAIEGIREALEQDVPLSSEDIDRIAERVWFYLITDPTTGVKRGAAHHVASAYKWAYEAAQESGSGASAEDVADEIARRLEE